MIEDQGPERLTFKDVRSAHDFKHGMYSVTARTNLHILRNEAYPRLQVEQINEFTARGLGQKVTLSYLDVDDMRALRDMLIAADLG